MSFSIIQGNAQTAVPNGGSINFSYGSGDSAALFDPSGAHQIFVNQDDYYAPTSFTVVFNPSYVTVTNLTGISWGQGTPYFLQLEKMYVGVIADAGTLTGTTLKSTVVNSSLTSVGTLTNLTVTNPIVGKCTTNANLTGPITSVGNATSVASQTGTGSKFVMDTSPVLITPSLGTPASGVLTNCTGTAAGLTSGDVANASVIAKVLTGFTSGPGVISASDTILTSIQKLNGNVAAISSPTGSVLQAVTTETTLNTAMTATIPLDSTIPQNTEGTQVLSVTITPVSASNSVKLRAAVFVGQSLGSEVIAIFRGATANAIAAAVGANSSTSMSYIEIVDSPATASAVTYTVRVGNSAAGTATLNKHSDLSTLGGVIRSVVTAEEIKG